MNKSLSQLLFVIIKLTQFIIFFIICDCDAVNLTLFASTSAIFIIKRSKFVHKTSIIHISPYNFHLRNIILKKIIECMARFLCLKLLESRNVHVGKTLISMHQIHPEP